MLSGMEDHGQRFWDVVELSLWWWMKNYILQFVVV